MSTSLGALIAGVLVAGVLLFARALRAERYDVRNRGVNQPALTTWARAGLRAAKLLLKFGGVLYLLAAFYAFYTFERVCARTEWTRATYQRAPLVEHITDALSWPLYLEGDPPCGATLLPPADSAG